MSVTNIEYFLLKDFWGAQNMFNINNYRKVASSSLSWLAAHFQNFRRLMKGKIDAYVQWPLAITFQNWIVDQSTARDFTVTGKNCMYLYIVKLAILRWKQQNQTTTCHLPRALLPLIPPNFFLRKIWSRNLVDPYHHNFLLLFSLKKLARLPFFLKSPL